MVEDGKLTPEDGVRLIDAVRRNRERRGPQRPRGRRLRVLIRGPDGKESAVAIPLPLARLALRLLPRSAVAAMESEGITVGDLDDLIANAQGALESSDVLEFESRGTRVTIRVEGP